MSPKRALVTGASHGIGLAIAKVLSHAGCEVYGAARTPGNLPWHIPHVHFDALEPASIAKMLETVGEIDILINNVGGGGRWGAASMIETAPEVWTQVYQKNVGVAVQAVRHALPHMRAKGWGRIVSISSINALEGSGRPWFVMAKASLNAFTKCMSQDAAFARHGITFNTVSPGRIAVGGAKDAITAREIDALPMGRIGMARDVAAVVAFLCSDKAEFVNGANILVDGGQSAII